MTRLLQRSNQKRIWVDEFDEDDWSALMQTPNKDYSWAEEAFLAGLDYFEEGKEFLRSN